MNADVILENITTSVIVTNRFMEIIHVNSSARIFLEVVMKFTKYKTIRSIFSQKEYHN